MLFLLHCFKLWFALGVVLFWYRVWVFLQSSVGRCFILLVVLVGDVLFCSVQLAERYDRVLLSIALKV